MLICISLCPFPLQESQPLTLLQSQLGYQDKGPLLALSGTLEETPYTIVKSSVIKTHLSYLFIDSLHLTPYLPHSLPYFHSEIIPKRSKLISPSPLQSLNKAMAWSCCKCSSTNTGSTVWCKMCKHYTVNCDNCFSFRRPNVKPIVDMKQTAPSDPEDHGL